MSRGVEAASAWVGAAEDPPYRLWVSEQRTVLVRMWATGTVEVATRESPAHTWGPPVSLTEEKVY